MGRLLNAVFGLVAFQAAMILFLGVTTPVFSLYEALLGLENWTNLAFIDYILGSISALGVGVATVGILTRNDLLVYLGIAGNLFGFGFVYVEAYQKILSLGWFGGNEQIVLLLFAPFILSWFFLILEFGRGRD